MTVTATPIAVITDPHAVAVLVAMAVAITALVVAAVVNRRASAVQGRLHRLDTIDLVTGLPLPAFARDELAGRIGGQWCALLIFELDRFAMVNEVYGQDVGDRLLASLATQLRGLCHSGETLTRWDGPRFALLSPGITTRDAGERRADELRAPLNAKVTIDHDALRVTVSVAVVLVDSSFTDLAGVVAAIDLALDAAHQEGRGSRVAFRPTMRRPELDAAVERLQRSIAGQLFVEYQPIVSLPDLGLAGMRAEPRWEDLGHGILAGQELDLLLDKADLVSEAAERMVAATIEQAAKWTKDHPTLELVVSMAVPSELLLDPAFPTWLATLVRDADADPASLCFEVSGRERTDLHASWAPLHAVAQLGIHRGLSDFGTAWSSLAYLRRQQVDVITLPADLLDDAVENRTDENIVRQLLGLATSLGVSAIAQGVADKAQEDLLTTMGCDLAMGPRYGGARGVADMEAVVQAGRITVGDGSPRRGRVGIQRR